MASKGLLQITKKSTILASNTSSISITRIANSTSRPDKVVGMHFMNPPPIMSLVELIKGMATSDEVGFPSHDFQSKFVVNNTNQVLFKAQHLAEAMGKKVCKSEDRPGFIVNR